MVRIGRSVADIGTDHAYLPIYLIQNNIAKNCIAADLREKPLKNAQSAINFYKLNDKIETVLSDGLDNISPCSADDFIFCGMGGILITQILDRAEWLKNPDKHIILQPMRHIEVVRKYLLDNSFDIIDEVAVEDEGRIYICINAVYTESFEPYSIYIGKLKVNDRLSAEYLNRQYRRFNTRLMSLQKAQIKPQEQEELRKIIKEFEDAGICTK